MGISQQAISRRGFVGAGLAGAAAWAAASRLGWGQQANEDGLDALLQRPVLKRGVTREQTWQFALDRVPLMPNVDSIEQWEDHAERIRREMFERVIFVGEARKWRESPPRVVWSDTIQEDGYKIRKVRYEVLPDYWMPALLYEPDNLHGRVPAIFCVHGHVGTGGGKARPVVQFRCINFVKRGMLAFTADWPDIGQLQANYRHYRVQQLDLCGTSGLAPFYLTLERALDIILEHPNTDPERVCINGQSGGGWQSIYLGALDKRVTLVNPVAGHASLRTRQLRDSEQAPNDMATVADYTHFTAMVAPRAQLLTFNAKDNCCYQTHAALPPLMEAGRPIYDLYGAGHLLRAHNNMVVDPEPRGHNFGRENREVLYRMVGEVFMENDPHFPRQDLDGVEDEFKSYEELFVELPEDNLNFNTMARRVVQGLPRDAEVPKDPKQRQAWQETKRPLLRRIVRFHDYDVQEETVEEQEADQLRAVYRRLRMGRDWDVPAVELIPPGAKDTVVLLADGGRREAAEQIAALLHAQRRVVAVDPFYFGESALGASDFLLSLKVTCSGERPLGIQASQVVAVCRWLHARDRQAPSVVGVGERTSTVALVAAALEAEAINALELYSPLESLKQIIDRDTVLMRSPELFCFGLLEWFDVPQLTALAEPRPVVRHA